MSETQNTIKSEFWQEKAQAEDAFCTEVSICSGYDVYGDLLGRASYFEYLFLLYKHQRPSAKQAAAFEILAVALANPGPRDPSVHAAMCCGASLSTAGASLQAAIACGAGSYGGAREVFLMAQIWQRKFNLTQWCEWLATPEKSEREDVWPNCEHPPGFAPYDRRCGKPVMQTLDKLASILPDGEIQWLKEHRTILEIAAGERAPKSPHGCRPLAMMGVAATCLSELGFTPHEAEMLVLMLRLPGAAAHALEQAKLGFRQFPFFSLELTDDPALALQKEEK